MEILLGGKEGGIALIDDEDGEMVKRHRWCGSRMGSRQHMHVVSRVNRKITKLSRFLLNVTDPNLVVDHINGDTLDNRKTNLRVCSSKENIRNSRLSRANSSGLKGVNRDRRWWRATIRVDGHYIHLGRYDTKEEAAAAYDQVAILFFGRFARTNKMLEATKTVQGSEQTNRTQTSQNVADQNDSIPRNNS